MTLHPPPSRILRQFPRHILKPQCRRPAFQIRSFASRAPPPRGERIDPITLHRLQHERREYYKRRSWYAGIGFVCGMIAIWFTATSIPLESANKPNKLDSGARRDDPMVAVGKERKVVVHKLGEEPEEIPDTVETGTSTVPTFPRVLNFSDDRSNDVEYQLVGLGIRTVSFLGVQVYVIGMYVATDDIAALQECLIHKIAPGGASTLVLGEKDELKKKLYNPEQGLTIWSDVLKESGSRTLIRIVPTRNTDFGHLRDAWVRHLTARAQANKEEFGDEAFGKAIQEFKTMFNRGRVPKGKELLLSRDKQGKFVAWYDNEENGAQRVGEVLDERISRALWLNYLAGKTVASEAARKSIIDGVMEFVERPVGTVAAQVHV